MAVTMSQVNEKVAKLTNTVASTPISLSELNEKVDNAIATGKDWAIISYRSVGTFSEHVINFDTKYNSYNYAIISTNMLYASDRGRLELHTGGIRLGNQEIRISISKSNGQIRMTSTVSFYVENMQILFYK